MIETRMQRLRRLPLVAAFAGLLSAAGGCGTVNVQAHGGGAEGFASLGVLILGTTALRHLRSPEREADDIRPAPLPPPDGVSKPRNTPDSTPAQNQDERDQDESP